MFDQDMQLVDGIDLESSSHSTIFDHLLRAFHRDSGWHSSRGNRARLPVSPQMTKSLIIDESFSLPVPALLHLSLDG
jgi:hypothetical protein